MTTKKQKTEYISKYHNLKLVNKASYSKEVGGKVIVMQGSAIQFENGVYETDDKDEIAFLDNHPNCGNVFIKVEKNVAKERAEMLETLEEREAKLKAREEAVAKKEMRLKGQGKEEGAKASAKGIKGTKSTQETKKPKF